MAEIYCFVDESINMQIGVVAIAVISTRGTPDDLYAVCEEIERRSGKGRAKWGKARWISRVRYFEQIESDSRFRNSLFFALRNDKPQIHEATVQAIAMVIEKICVSEADKRGHVSILVDALSKQKRHEYRTALSQRGLRISKVRGVAKDENDSLIRLADSLAGLVNDAAGGSNHDAQRLLERIERNGTATRL